MNAEYSGERLVIPGTTRDGRPQDLQKIAQELGNQGIEHSIEKSPEVLLPREVTLLSYDPNEKGSLGNASFEEFTDFVVSHGAQPKLATQIWNKLTYESAKRARNNSLFEATLELREQYTSAKFEQARLVQLEERRLRGELSDDDLVWMSSQEFIEVVEDLNYTLTLLKSWACEFYCNITGEKVEADAKEQAAKYVLDELVEPEAAGPAYVFYENDEGGLIPATKTAATREDYQACHIALYEIYRTVLDRLSMIDKNRKSIGIARYIVAFLNSRIVIAEHLSSRKKTNQLVTAIL